MRIAIVMYIYEVYIDIRTNIHLFICMHLRLTRYNIMHSKCIYIYIVKCIKTYTQVYIHTLFILYK